ncbi:MAG: phosphate acyltransferase PlsX [Actinomycetia bacterium]|nr:phosphate acyltransferase PlsX [Actinomycetes bacterium]MCP3910493.1 phosphate acyltransferase PlsX [Actinomycetes bacterium]MCP4087826.1 phosphate acyltransferase PlsX [Actinomycetes bacterium]
MAQAGLPVAVDAMGGDDAPTTIVSGVNRAADDYGIPVLLVGRPDEIGAVSDMVTIREAAEVITMDDEPGSSVRRKKDASMVRAAEAVRDGEASALVGAGNTGATMASALLRMGRIKGVGRPGIAIPIPVPSRGTPTVMLDAGANAECTPEMLVQFAQMGVVYSQQRFGIENPQVGVLSIGEEPTKGNTLVKEANGLLAQGSWSNVSGGRFLGNVEGRDLMHPVVDVVVTDGFTGNVVLKTLEGGMQAAEYALCRALEADVGSAEVLDVVNPVLEPVWNEILDPESRGGAMLLGVKGLCVICHGSASERAIANAIRSADELARAGMVDRMAAAIAG